MLDPVFAFFAGILRAIGRGFRWLIATIIWPFAAFRRWLRGRGWFIKIPVFAILVALVIGYGYLFYITQFWYSDDPEYVESFDFRKTSVGVGERLPDNTCQSSAIVVVASDLIDRNVNTDTWVSSNPLSKAGLFGIEWKDTPFFDNKAAFQLGINQALRRTAIELVDRLGRVRGTSSINQNLQEAREAMNYREDAWYATFSPPFLQPTTQSRMRDARRKLLAFNEELSRCQADFDARADNLLQFLDRVTGDIGSTSEIIQRRLEAASFIGFDRRADDRFWFTYGQLYAYYAILAAARSDFRTVVQQRNLDAVWNNIDQNFRDSLRIRPPFVMNGSASSIIKSHLEAIGFNLLRVRSNLVELRDVLDR